MKQIKGIFKIHIIDTLSVPTRKKADFCNVITIYIVFAAKISNNYVKSVRLEYNIICILKELIITLVVI